MSKKKMSSVKNLIIKVAFVLVFFIVLIVFIAFARGYRFSVEEKSITSTGILTVSSGPKAAKIYVNGELKGVTDNSLTLQPDTYTIEVKKDGYTSWKKDITLKGEIVHSLEAILFPKNPSLSPLTNLGIQKAIPVGNSHRVILFADSEDTQATASPTSIASLEASLATPEAPITQEELEKDRDGIYLFEEVKQPISIFAPLKTVVLKDNLPPDIDFEQTEVIFAPDYEEAIFTFTTEISTEEANLEEEPLEYSYLLSLEEENEDPFEVTNSVEAILEAWLEEKTKETDKVLETFPKEIRKIATDSFDIIAFASDETKMLYQAKKDANIPIAIDPPLIGTNQTEEKRKIQAGNLYIYDKKEDKNFVIPFDPKKIPEEKTYKALDQADGDITSDEEKFDISNLTRTQRFASYIQWFPSSKHLIFNEGKQIVVMEYDGKNKQTVYSGPYDNAFFSTSYDWKLYILANLNPQNNTYGDLYEVGIR